MFPQMCEIIRMEMKNNQTKRYLIPVNTFYAPKRLIPYGLPFYYNSMMEGYWKGHVDMFLTSEEELYKKDQDELESIMRIGLKKWHLVMGPDEKLLKDKIEESEEESGEL